MSENFQRVQKLNARFETFWGFVHLPNGPTAKFFKKKTQRYPFEPVALAKDQLIITVIYNTHFSS